MDSLYTIGVALSMETTGFTLAANQVLGAFKNIESSATRADTAVGRFAPRLDRSFASLEQSAQKVGTAYDKANASMQAIANGTGLMPEQRAANLAAHAKDMDALTAAQARLAAQQSKYNDLLAQEAAATQAATAAHEQWATAQRAATQMAVGGGLLLGGLGLFNYLKGAAEQASQLTTTMTQIQLATGASEPQMAALQNLAVHQGTRTQFSLNEEASIAAALTRTRINDVSTLMTMLPSVTNFAEIMKMARGESPTQSATVAAEFAHLFGQYGAGVSNSGPGMEYMTNLLGRALAITPASPDEFKNLISQFAGQMRPLYGTTEQGRQRFISDAISVAMLEAQMGQQTRGGTQIGQMISRTLGGATATGNTAQDKALREISKLAHGRSFFNDQGAFAGISNALTVLELAAASKGETPEALGLLFKDAFGMVGNRQAGILADPTTVKQFAQIGALLDPKTGLVSLDKMRQAYNATPEGQAARAAAEWSTLSTLLGQTIIPLLNDALGALANFGAGIDNFASDHPLLTKIAAGFLALSSAVMTAAGAVAILKGGWALLDMAGFLGPIRKLSEAFRGLAGSEEAVAAAGDAAAAGEAAAAAGGAGGVGKVATAGRALSGFGTLGEAAAASAAGASLGAVAVGTAMFTAPAAIYMYAETPGGRKQVRGAVHATDDFITQHTPWGTIEKAFGTGPILGGVLHDIQEAGYGLFGGRPKATPPRPVQQHIQHVDIHVQTHPNQNPHQIAAATKQALKELGGGFDIAALYGGYNFTSNPTLRSGGQ